MEAIKHGLRRAGCNEEQVADLTDRLMEKGIVTVYGIRNLDNGYLMREMKITKQFLRKAILKVGDFKGTFVFLSHVKKEAGESAGTLRENLAQEFGSRKIFLDVENEFPLRGLSHEVSDTFVFVVLASQNYLKRPFCAVELITAHRNSLHLKVVNFTGQNSTGFNYAEEREKWTKDQTTFVKSLLDDDGWKELERHGMTVADYEIAVEWFLDYKGRAYGALNEEGVKKAQLEGICRHLYTYVPQYDAQHPEMSLLAQAKAQREGENLIALTTARVDSNEAKTAGNRLAKPADKLIMASHNTRKRPASQGEEEEEEETTVLAAVSRADASSVTDRVLSLPKVGGRSALMHNAFEIPATASVSALTWNPDPSEHTKVALVYGTKQAQVTMVNRTFTDPVKLEVHIRCINSVSIDANGYYLASASDDKTVTVWNVSTARLMLTIRRSRAVRLVCFHPDASVLAVCCVGDDTICFYEASSMFETRRRLKTNQTIITVTCFNSGGTRFATGSEDKTAKVWTMPKNELLRVFVHEGAITSMSFNGDGSRLSCSCLNMNISVWDVENGAQRILQGQSQDFVSSVCFHPSDSVLSSVSWDSTISVWNVDRSTKLDSLPADGILRLASFHPSAERVAIVCRENHIIRVVEISHLESEAVS